LLHWYSGIKDNFLKLFIAEKFVLEKEMETTQISIGRRK